MDCTLGGKLLASRKMPSLSLTASIARLVANSLSRLSKPAKNEAPAAGAGGAAASADARQPKRR